MNDNFQGINPNDMNYNPRDEYDDPNPNPNDLNKSQDEDSSENLSGQVPSTSPNMIHRPHTHRSSRRFRYHKKRKKRLKKKHILVIAGIVSLIIVIIFLLSGSSSKEGIYGVGKSITIRTNIYKMSISVGEVQRGVTYSSDGSILSAFDFNGLYTKIQVNVSNLADKEISFSNSVVPMALTDANKNVLGYCSYGTSVRDSRVENEKLQDKIAAKTAISGYVYCKTNSNSGEMLSISIPMSAKRKSDGSLEVRYNEYYFQLAK